MKRKKTNNEQKDKLSENIREKENKEGEEKKKRVRGKAGSDKTRPGLDSFSKITGPCEGRARQQV